MPTICFARKQYKFAENRNAFEGNKIYWFPSGPVIKCLLLFTGFSIPAGPLQAVKLTLEPGVLPLQTALSTEQTWDGPFSCPPARAPLESLVASVR